MKSLRRHRAKALIVLALGSVLVAAVVWPGGRPDPDAKFRAVTGRQLPPGVHATAYASETTDNLFRRTHYWLLTGPPAALRQVTAGTGFAESLEDARATLPDVQRLFGVPLSGKDVVAGYEAELDRNRWFCIFADGTTALYAH
jgi:hypothetical protein